MALFGNAAVASSKNLVEFRAGKMTLKGTTVSADKRKGQVYVHQSDDSLMHFCWKDRTSGTLEDDLIIFPDDIEFKRVSQCTTGRVYVLKFKSSSRKFFFWIQEPKEDKDEEYCKKINSVLNNPPTPGSNGGGNNPLAGLQPALASVDQLGDSSLQSLLNGMDQNQLMQLLGMSQIGGGSATSVAPSDPPSTQSSAASVASSTPATPVPSAGVQLSDLQNVLSNMQAGGGAGAAQESVDLSSSFSTEALLPLLSDKDVQERLQPFLPAVFQLKGSGNELKDTIQSPQFKQALSVFSAALSSGQLAPLMQQFKLSQSAIDAAANGDIIAFMKALQEPSEPVEDMALD